MLLLIGGQGLTARYGMEWSTTTLYSLHVPTTMCIVCIYYVVYIYYYYTYIHMKVVPCTKYLILPNYI